MASVTLPSTSIGRELAGSMQRVLLVSIDDGRSLGYFAPIRPVGAGNSDATAPKVLPIDEQVQLEIGGLDVVTEFLGERGELLGLFVPTPQVDPAVLAKAEAVLRNLPLEDHPEEGWVSHSDLWKRIHERVNSASK